MRFSWDRRGHSQPPSSWSPPWQPTRITFLIRVDDKVNAKWHYILSDEGHLPRPLLPQVRGQISNPEMKSLVPGGIPNNTFAHKIIFKTEAKIFKYFRVVFIFYRSFVTRNSLRRTIIELCHIISHDFILLTDFLNQRSTISDLGYTFQTCYSSRNNHVYE